MVDTGACPAKIIIGTEAHAFPFLHVSDADRSCFVLSLTSVAPSRYPSPSVRPRHAWLLLSAGELAHPLLLRVCPHATSLLCALGFSVCGSTSMHL
jgi:hypothetical protein